MPNETEAQLYVNDDCSKCRSALTILDEKSVDAQHIRYLEEPRRWPTSSG